MKSILSEIGYQSGRETICFVGSEDGRFGKWNVGVLVNKMYYYLRLQLLDRLKFETAFWFSVFKSFLRRISV